MHQHTLQILGIVDAPDKMTCAALPKSLIWFLAIVLPFIEG